MFYRVNNFIIPFFLLVLFCPLLIILALNDGVFSYSLDDPFIHLAMAENILNGHYGYNKEEFSSPSSSILWPFLLAPFQAVDEFGFTPLILNLLFALITLLIVYRLIQEWFEDEKTRIALIVLFVFFTNIVGVIYTGMEHSLQILITVLIFRGGVIICEAGEKQQKLPLWLLVVLILAPLIRYENIVMCLAVGLLAMYKGHWKVIVLTGIVAVIALLSFSYFLYSIDLNFFPASVNSKSVVVAENGSIFSFFKHMLLNMVSKGGYTHLVLMYFLWKAFRDDSFSKDEQTFSLTLLIASILHFLGGRYGWFSRYELYIFIPVLLWVGYLYKSKLESFVNIPLQQKGIILFLVICLTPYLHATLMTPVGAHNVYSQQYQMQRFVKDYYRAPVAVNDIGWVSYRNEHYVLDLWGLSSSKTFSLMISASNPLWMEGLAEKNQVGLAMVYPVWFSNVPENWVLVGKLRLLDDLIFLDREVYFYATDLAFVKDLSPKLKEFALTLPDSVEFIFLD